MGCPLCKRVASMRLWNFYETTAEQKLPLYKCTSCGLIRPSPLPYRASEAAAVYEDNPMKTCYDVGAHDVPSVTQAYKEYAVLFKPYATQWAKLGIRGTHLDIGCGSGHLLFLSKDAGLKPEGTEFDKSLVVTLRRKGLHVHHGDLDVVLKTRKRYDVVTANHVLEHIVDIDKFIRQVNALLKKNGYFILASPYIYGLYPRIVRTGWYGQGYGQHINFFSKKSLRKLLARNGFEMVSIRTLSMEHVPAGTPGLVRPVIEAGFGMLNLVELGDNLFVVARRRR